MILKPGEITLVNTSTRIQMPKSFYAMVCSNSGLASKGVFVLNSPGIIDSFYVDDIKVILCNLGKEAITIGKNEKIAQLIFVKSPKVDLESVSGQIDNKGTRGGFGSTGIF